MSFEKSAFYQAETGRAATRKHSASLAGHRIMLNKKKALLVGSIAGILLPVLVFAHLFYSHCEDLGATSRRSSQAAPTPKERLSSAHTRSSKSRPSTSSEAAASRISADQPVSFMSKLKSRLRGIPLPLVGIAIALTVLVAVSLIIANFCLHQQPAIAPPVNQEQHTSTPTSDPAPLLLWQKILIGFGVCVLVGIVFVAGYCIHRRMKAPAVVVDDVPDQLSGLRKEIIRMNPQDPGVIGRCRELWLSFLNRNMPQSSGAALLNPHENDLNCPTDEVNDDQIDHYKSDQVFIGDYNRMVKFDDDKKDLIARLMIAYNAKHGGLSNYLQGQDRVAEACLFLFCGNDGLPTGTSQKCLLFQTFSDMMDLYFSPSLWLDPQEGLAEHIPALWARCASVTEYILTDEGMEVPDGLNGASGFHMLWCWTLLAGLDSPVSSQLIIVWTFFLSFGDPNFAVCCMGIAALRAREHEDNFQKLFMEILSPKFVWDWPNLEKDTEILYFKYHQKYAPWLQNPGQYGPWSQNTNQTDPWLQNPNQV